MDDGNTHTVFSMSTGYPPNALPFFLPVVLSVISHSSSFNLSTELDWAGADGLLDMWVWKESVTLMRQSEWLLLWQPDEGGDSVTDWPIQERTHVREWELCSVSNPEGKLSKLARQSTMNCQTGREFTFTVCVHSTFTICPKRAFIRHLVCPAYKNANSQNTSKTNLVIYFSYCKQQKKTQSSYDYGGNDKYSW